MDTEQGMSLNSVLRRVRRLVTLAEHPETSPAEAQLARQKADALMLKYAVDEATARTSQPAAERPKPTVIEVSIGQQNEITGYVTGMLRDVAGHCRCKVRQYARFDREAGEYYSRVYGFESDVRYLEVLYTTLRLHMLGALRPQINTHESLDENAYRLHNAGYNWLEIAELYGWRKQSSWNIQREHERGMISDELNEKYRDGKAEIWFNKEADQYKTNWQVGSSVKRAYNRAVTARGERPTKISAGGSHTYRLSAAAGYMSRIHQRLRSVAISRETGGGLVLRSAAGELEDFYREANAEAYTRCPSCHKLSRNAYDCDRCGHHMADLPVCEACEKAASGYCRAHKPRATKDTPFSYDAYRIGVAHANTADITGRNVPGGSARPISS